MAPTDHTPDPAPDPAMARSSPADTIARLRRAMRRAARAADPASPLPVAQLEVLACLAEAPRARPGELARRLKLAPNSVTTLVNALHARGLITRSPAPQDARALTLALTPDGHRAVRRWTRTNTTIIQAALTMLDPRHQRALTEAAQALHALANAVDTLAENPSPVQEADDAHPADPLDRG
jgi:DNA-binding MarR family transcriptional regulator